MGWINSGQFERDHNGLRNTCSACGHDATATNPLVLSADGSRIHQAHTRDNASGFYGAEQQSDVDCDGW
jgi:hypothetical protein